MKKIFILLLLFPVAVISQSLNKNFVKTITYKDKSDGTYANMSQTFDMSNPYDAQYFFSNTGQGTIQVLIIDDILTVNFDVVFSSPVSVNYLSQTPYINSSSTIPNTVLGNLNCGSNFPNLFKVSIESFGNCIYIEPNYSALGATATSFNQIFTISLADLNNPGYSEDQKTEQITYFDGIGRPIQDIALKQSPDKENIILHYEYDTYGRSKREFLPFASSQINQNFVSTAATDQFDFYSENQQFNDDYAFTDKVYDKSPLNRVLKKGAVGEPWQPNPSLTNTNDHVVRYEYKFNSSTSVVFKVKKYKANSIFDPTRKLYTSSLENQSGTVFYDVNNLTKTVIKNENWKLSDGIINTFEEFSNKQGQVVLKRGFSKVNEVVVPHDTYYVYNQYGNLSFVIPPKVDAFLGSELNDLCYQYLYDKRNRLVEKKIPGKGWEYVIYNNLDQPILTQDAKLKAQGKWLFTKYDALGRIVYTGEYSNNTIRETIQSELQEVSTPTLYEIKANTALSIGGTNVYYSNNSFPSSNINLFTINYYDNYVFDLAGITVPTSVYGSALTTKTKTLVTGAKIRTLGTNQWTTAVTGYDDKARSIWSRSINPTLLTDDHFESKLDFIGKVIETKSTHSKTGIIGSLPTYNYYEYDHAERLLKHTQKVGSNATELITFNKYDKLGSLQEKKTGNAWTPFTAVGVTKANGTYTRAAAGNNWTGAKIYSSSELIEHGNLSFRATASSSNVRIGLTSTATPQNITYNQIQFALEFQSTVHVAGGKQVKVFLGSIDLGVKSNYIDGDEFTIEKIGTTMYFKKNKIEFFSTEAFASAYKPAVYFFQNLTTLKDIMLHNYSYENVVALEKIRYDFNIRGWLTGINKPTVSVPSPNELFSFELHYNNPTAGATALYNGNISQTAWKTKYDSSWKNYSYSYDGLNRLKEALYKNASSSTWNTSFFEKLDYDKMGNITNLKRSGNVVATPGMEQMDVMTYDYDGNKLMRIKEEGNTSNGFSTPILATNTDNQYSYDINGNMTRDLNKGITDVSGGDGITYNHLNLPTQILFNGNSATKINYTYNALGVKLRKVVTNGVNVITTEYGSGYSYSKVNAATFKLDFMTTSEGYSTITDNSVNTLSYVYQYKDHLGNIRLSYSDANKDGAVATTEIIEENHYYPFGMKHSVGIAYGGGNANAQKYKYNGKEYQDDIIGGFQLNLYDYGARNYDPAIGRWMNIDPLAENSRRWTPYNYAYNNPIYFVDPDGMQAYPPTEEELDNFGIPISRITDGYTWTDKDGSWAFNSANKTWEGQNGTDVDVVAATVQLDEVVIQREGFNIIEVMWNSDIAREYVSDSYTIGISTNISAFVGASSTPYNFTFLTRGKDIGLYSVPNSGASLGTGGSANIGISFSKGKFTGNPRKIESSFLMGNSYGVSTGAGLGLGASVNTAFAPVDINNLGRGGFMTLGGQIGLGAELSPATLLNFELTLQNTPQVSPIFKLN